MNVATLACIILQKRDVWEIFSGYRYLVGREFMYQLQQKKKQLCMSESGTANVTHNFTLNPERGIRCFRCGRRTRRDGQRAQASVV